MCCAKPSRLRWGMIAGLWLSVCSGPTDLLGAEKGGQPQVKQSELIVGDPVKYAELTVFPITSRVAGQSEIRFSLKTSG